MIRTYRYGSPRPRGEGLRIGTTRYLPRGVRKEDYARLDFMDLWLPIVAPSARLLNWIKSKNLNDPAPFRAFAARYEQELRKSTEARQTLHLLAKMSERQPIAIGCFCEDERFCHRSVLESLIRRAARDRL